MIKAYLKMWKNTFNYRGISSRKDYWLAILLHYIICFIYLILMICLIDETNKTVLGLAFILACTYLFIHIFPYISLTTRRLHDIGISGWWQLLRLAPPLGTIIVLIFMCLPQKLDNNVFLKN